MDYFRGMIIMTGVVGVVTTTTTTTTRKGDGATRNNGRSREE